MKFLTLFINRTQWSYAEDVKLLEESLIFPKKWAILSKIFPGRTQHNVKNRFIFLIGKELNVKREKCLQMIRGNNINLMVGKALEELNLTRKHQGRSYIKEENNDSISFFHEEDQMENEEKNDESFENAVNFLFGKENSDSFV